MGHENVSIICCGKDADVTNTRRQVVWTVKASNVQRFLGNVDLMRVRRINGRKRHILVDTLGLLLTIVVTAASVQDRDSARLLLRHLIL
jgi:hypothetical protein